MVTPLVNNSTSLVGNVNYYSIDVAAPSTNDSLSTLKIDFHPTDTKSVTVYARFCGIPSVDLHDAVGMANSLTLTVPRIGKWIIAVINTTDGTSITPNATTNTCHNNTAGIDCKINITSSSSLQNKFATTKLSKANDTVVYALANIKFNSLYVSLYDTASDKKASIFASFNRVPVLTANGIVGADINGCNDQFCTKVQSINSNSGSTTYQQNGTWYVTIVAGRDNNEVNFWYDNICPNNCSTKGTCASSGDNYGLCTCPADTEGLLCTSNNMLIEYIILIIIAALVLVSALLGLIAWAYMRRRAQYVEVR
jgi:hypothetical protein